ncbi:MAG TPA: 4a-hydroxytetrahydrobiopterin dehydratase [archaeon]|nr:4a-hydroxytetrahydrobiopterin dehydratase [archaeon]
MSEKIPKGWKKQGKFLVRKFKFKNFIEAVGFVNIVASIAEGLNHHPDIYLENYKELTIKTTTHDKNKLTELDFELASKIEKVFSQ